MTYKIYTKGNYLVIEDISKKEVFYGHSKEVIVDKNNINKSNYKVYNVKNWDSSRVIEIGRILKEDNTLYTEVEFDIFYLENTGNFNKGSVIDPQILDALNTANLPSGSNPFATIDDIEITSLDSVVVNTDGTLTINFNGTQSITTNKSVLDIKYNVQNYNDLLLIVSQNLYDFAYVREEQGIKWLPGSLGGTYYGAGLYMWDGVAWVESKTNIYNEINNILGSKSDVLSYIEVEEDYNVDYNSIVNFLSGSFNATLPTAVNNVAKKITITNTGNGIIKILPFGVETIQGESEQKIYTNETFDLISNGQNWIVI